MLGMAPLSWLLVRSSPEDCGLAVESEPVVEAEARRADANLIDAVRSPAFWAFSLACSLYGLLASAISLFPQAVLEKQGFDYDTFRFVLLLGAVCGVITNLVGGWLAMRFPLGRLLGLAMLLLAGCLVVFPGIFTLAAVVLYSVGMGVAGGLITVIFFAFYGRTYGRKNLGQIQGTAQVISVFASALGPVLLTSCNAWTGSYALMYYSAALLAAVLGTWVWWVPLARPVPLMASEAELRAAVLDHEGVPS
jgi:predicted MFS family arabinose efflux permease